MALQTTFHNPRIENDAITLRQCQQSNLLKYILREAIHVDVTSTYMYTLTSLFCHSLLSRCLRYFIYTDGQEHALIKTNLDGIHLIQFHTFKRFLTLNKYENSHNKVYIFPMTYH